jgi:hypothetical protein
VIECVSVKPIPRMTVLNDYVNCTRRLSIVFESQKVSFRSASDTNFGMGYYPHIDARVHRLDVNADLLGA